MNSAQKLQQEVDNLRAEIQRKEEQIQSKDGLLKAQDSRLKQNQFLIQNLQAQLASLQKHKFGSSSEKNDKQLPLFNEAEQITDGKPKVKGRVKKKKAGFRKPLPEALEREQVIYDLSDDKKVCPKDGAELKHIGEQTSEQLKFIPASVKVIKHVCHKYACPKCNKQVMTASKPKDPIPKSIASPELLSYVTVSKYADGLPLYRLSQMFKRLDIAISRTNLASWMIRCGQLIQPLINLLEDQLFEAPYMHIDETTVQVLNEPGKKAQSKSYFWVRRAANTILFHYSPSRSAQVAEKLTADYQGAVMSDGYLGYDQLPQTQLGCWVHARRYFIKVLDQGEHPGAQKMVELIGELYSIEKQIKDQPADLRRKARAKQSQAILKKIKADKDDALHGCTPQSPFGKALGYLHKQWPKLIRYTDDDRYPIDNNPAENAIRPFVIGRKNWLFAGTQNGAKASANLYSLIETAKAHGINPETYLTKVYRKLPNCNSIEQIESLLPENFKPE